MRKLKRKTWWRNTIYFFGIDSLSTERWNARLKPRFFIIVFSVFGFCLITVLAVGKYSTSPSFCNSCHIMEPYYTAWKNSKHKNVACVDCHYPPDTTRTILWKKFQAMSQIVRYVTRTYSSKPFAEVEDASCLRSGCHTTSSLKGEIITDSGIKFKHTTHIMEKRYGRRLKCVTCHSQIVVGKHVEVTYDSCYLCHLKEFNDENGLQPVVGCEGCHKLPDKTFKRDNMTYNHEDYVKTYGVPCRDCHLEVVQGDGEAPQERCFVCHNQPEKLTRYKEIRFIHENHVTKHKVACFHCHQEIRHGFIYEKVKDNLIKLDNLTAKVGVTETDKQESHPPTITFKCSHCHQGKHASQLEIYSGQVSLPGIPDMPSPMYLAHVDCVACHYIDSQSSEESALNGKSLTASNKSCVKCHGIKFKGIWDKTKKELKKTLTKLSEKIVQANTYIENSSLTEKELDKIKDNMKKVKRYYNFLLTARGEHNIYLASWIIREMDKILATVEVELKTELSDISKLPLVSGRYCSTLCHFKTGVKTSAIKVNAFGKEMSYMGHAAMIACVECHEIGSHKKIPLKKDVQKKICINCHNSEE